MPDDTRVTVTWVVTERVFVCCRTCAEPGDCASKDQCTIGLDETQRTLQAPVEADTERA